MSSSSTVVACVSKSSSRRSKSSTRRSGCSAASGAAARRRSALSSVRGHVEVERIAELERPRLVGPRHRRAARVDRVAARAILAQRAVDLGERLRADAADRARRQLGGVAAVREVAGAPQRGLEIAQDHERARRVLREQLAQLLGRDRLEVPLGEVPRQLLDRLETLADPLRRLVVRRLGATEALALALRGSARARAAARAPRAARGSPRPPARPRSDARRSARSPPRARDASAWRRARKSFRRLDSKPWRSRSAACSRSRISSSRRRRSCVAASMR